MKKSGRKKRRDGEKGNTIMSFHPSPRASMRLLLPRSPQTHVKELRIGRLRAKGGGRRRGRGAGGRGTARCGGELIVGVLLRGREMV